MIEVAHAHAQRSLTALPIKSQFHQFLEIFILVLLLHALASLDNIVEDLEPSIFHAAHLALLHAWRQVWFIHSFVIELLVFEDHLVLKVAR